MIFNYNGTELKMKYSFRALMLYENITKQSFAPQNMTDILVFFYCCVLSADKTITIKFDDFMDIIDENPKYVIEFSTWLTQQFEQQQMVSEEVDKKETSETEQDPNF